MKQRSKGFLSQDNIDQDGEQFDYIVELHRYLWQFIYVAFPNASGNLSDYVDKALVKLQAAEQNVHLTALRRGLAISMFMNFILWLVVMYFYISGR